MRLKNKIIIVLFFILAVGFLPNLVNAYTEEDLKARAFSEFEEGEFETSSFLEGYDGDGVWHHTILKTGILGQYLDLKIENDHNDIVEIKGPFNGAYDELSWHQYVIVFNPEKIGTTNITITATYKGQIKVQKVKVSVVEKEEYIFENFKNNYKYEDSYIKKGDTTTKSIYIPENAVVTLDNDAYVELLRKDEDEYAYISAKDIGTTSITVSLTYKGQVENKKFKVIVVETDEKLIEQTWNRIKYDSKYVLDIGEQMNILQYEILKYQDADFSVAFDKTDVARLNSQERKNDWTITAIKEGTTKVTITLKYFGKIASKSFDLVVNSYDEALESKDNDVVAISNYNNKIKAYLKNGQTLNIDVKNLKIKNKEKGKFSQLVYKNAENGNGYGEYVLEIVKNRKLTIYNGLEQKIVKDIKGYSKSGYLKKNGDYFIVKNKRDFFEYKEGWAERKMLINRNIVTQVKVKNVQKILSDSLLKKSNKLYTTDGKKICNIKIKDAKGTSTKGIFLDKSGNLYKFTYNKSKKKYIVTKIKSKVKSLKNENEYITKAGKTVKINKSVKIKSIKKPVIYSSYKTNKGIDFSKMKKEFYSVEYEKSAIKMSNIKVFTNYAGIYKVSEKEDKYVVIRTDGSIWIAEIADSYKFIKIRSGKEEEKKIERPSNVKAKKISKTKAKVTWSRVNEATKYIVYRSTSKNKNYKKVSTTTSAFYTDKKVKKGKTYYYKVKAVCTNSKYNSKNTVPVKVKI